MDSRYEQANLRDLTGLRQAVAAKEAAKTSSLSETTPLETLISIARNETRNWRLRQFLGLAIALGYLGSVLLPNWVQESLRIGARAVMVVLYFGGASHLGLLGRMSRKQIKVLNQLITSGDMLVIGPLLEAHEVAKSRGADAIKTEMETALAQLLARVTATDNELLNNKQRTCLYQLLKECTMVSLMKRDIRNLYVAIEVRNDALVHAILKAVEQIGDENAMPVLEKIIHAPATSDTARRIQNAAEECGVILRERLERERLGQTLLRPATTSAKELLRPAQDDESLDSRWLLRSCDGEAKNDVEQQCLRADN